MDTTESALNKTLITVTSATVTEISLFFKFLNGRGGISLGKVERGYLQGHLMGQIW